MLTGTILKWTHMTSYKQGDIVLVWFPNSDLTTLKKRPAIILQADSLNTGLDQVIISMITSNIERKYHKSRIFVDTQTEIGKKTGLLSNSVIMTDNIATVLHSEIYKKIGSLAPQQLKDPLRNTFAI